MTDQRPQYTIETIRASSDPAELLRIRDDLAGRAAHINAQLEHRDADADWRARATAALAWNRQLVTEAERQMRKLTKSGREQPVDPVAKAAAKAAARDAHARTVSAAAMRAEQKIQSRILHAVSAMQADAEFRRQARRLLDDRTLTAIERATETALAAKLDQIFGAGCGSNGSGN